MFTLQGLRHTNNSLSKTKCCKKQHLEQCTAQLCSGLCIYCLPANTQGELTVSGSDNRRENAPISHFSKVVKNLSRAASPQGPHWCILKDLLPSLHLIQSLFSSHARKAVAGELQKGKTGRAPGPSEVLSKAFPFCALSHRYSSRQLKRKDGKNFGLEKNFSTSKWNVATGLSIWNRKKGKKGLK